MELTEEEQKFINDNAEMIRAFAASEFAGEIGMHLRPMFESIAWKINGRSFPICFTCSASIQQVGRLLSIKL